VQLSGSAPNIITSIGDRTLSRVVLASDQTDELTTHDASTAVA